MQRFSKIGQRVKVVRDVNDIALNAPGTVVRIRVNDDAAWVALDVRSKVKKVHPFPEGDHRGTHVLCLPEDCEPARGNARERRAAKHDDENVWPEPSIESFGKDHWSTFGYLMTTMVDTDGHPHRERMRCNLRRHPQFADATRDAAADVKAPWRYPTRMKNGATLADHDDWDCLDDLIRLGLLVNIGTAVNPQLRSTELGDAMWIALRNHKLSGGNFADFEPKAPAKAEAEAAAPPAP